MYCTECIAINQFPWSPAIGWRQVQREPSWLYYPCDSFEDKGFRKTWMDIPFVIHVIWLEIFVGKEIRNSCLLGKDQTGKKKPRQFMHDD